MREENFGYSVQLPEVTSQDIIRDLQTTKKSYRRYAAFSFLEALAIPYVADKCSGVFSEPWDGVMSSAFLLSEILAIGACLYSAYTWKRASTYLSELEQKIFQEE